MKRPLFKSLALMLGVLLMGIVFSGCNPLDKTNKAGIQVITNPGTSSVFLNDQYLDKSPLVKKDIKPGVYSLKIVPDDPNLTPYDTSVTLNKSLLTVVTWKPGPTPQTSGGVTYQMEPLKNKNQTEVSFVTIPDNAIITVTDRPKEFAPIIFSDIAPGQVGFEVTLPSYETQKHTLNVSSGYRINVMVKLAKLSTDNQNTFSETTPTVNLSATPSAELSSTPSAELSSTPSANPNATATTITGPKVKILPTGYFQDNKEVLRVRSSPSSSGKELGFADVGQFYQYLGETQVGWLKIRFNQQDGWITGQFAEIIE